MGEKDEQAGEALRRYHLRRAMLLGQHEAPTRVVTYSFSLSVQKGDEDTFRVSNETGVVFRARRLLTNVQEPNTVLLTSLTVGGEEQLLAAVDAYRFSLAYCGELDRAFLEANGLMSKTDSEVDAWLERHDLTMPSTTATRVDLPTVAKGVELAVRGSMPRMPKGFQLVVTFTGEGRE